VLLPALHKIDGSCVIDGELCALDAHGRSRFQLLQNALNKNAKLLYVVFDALFVGGKDIREKPLLERKKILKALMPRPRGFTRTSIVLPLRLCEQIGRVR